MTSFTQKIFILIFINLVFSFAVDASTKIKREYKDLYPLSDVSGEIADQDLEAGLRSLSSAELRTLSEFIDEESNNSGGNDFLNTFENYWKDGSSFKPEKKKRTIDDLYEELAHENAEIEIRDDSSNNALRGPFNDGKCHCKAPDEKAETIRTKRNSLGENVGNEPTNEEYVRDLEDSFPRNQENKIDNDDNGIKHEHIRIKRL